MLALKEEGSGVVLNCHLPHLIGINEDLLSNGIILYYLKVKIRTTFFFFKCGSSKFINLPLTLCYRRAEPLSVLMRHHADGILVSPSCWNLLPSYMSALRW